MAFQWWRVSNSQPSGQVVEPLAAVHDQHNFILLSMHQFTLLQEYSVAGSDAIIINIIKQPL